MYSSSSKPFIKATLSGQKWYKFFFYVGSSVCPECVYFRIMEVFFKVRVAVAT